MSKSLSTLNSQVEIKGQNVEFRGISFCHGREYLRFKNAEGKMIYISMFPREKKEKAN